MNPSSKPDMPQRVVRQLSPTIVWFRHDLRLADHEALRNALEQGGSIIPVFIWSPEDEAPWSPGAASRWWLHQSLHHFSEQLRAKGSRLIIRCGPAQETLQSLIRETGAGALYGHRSYEPRLKERETAIQTALSASGIKVEFFQGVLLQEPESVKNQRGAPFRVFTPFWRHCLRLLNPGIPLPTPRSLPAPKRWPASLALEELDLEPKIDWAAGLRAAWRPGSVAAETILREFVNNRFANYSQNRNRPDAEGTSRLSPYLHFGEMSPRQVWHALKQQGESQSLPESPWRHSQFLTELGWREFAYHLLYHFPHTPDQPLRREFQHFPWRENPEWLERWQQGRTGYPLVDAGMRQLWTTGWMHNRVRMVTASFLVKHLLLPWQAGARWFWDTLVDADLANNTLGWQWTSGCGADAAPFFRIFNPVGQGEKFDPQGHYVRRWVPELARLPESWIHQPWQAPPSVLHQAGVALDRTYPKPLVSHLIAREVALEKYQQFNRNSRPQAL